ncbi:MAG: gamma-glutamyl-gamma-aminobutyrate hydrolase family protein [Pseudorhodoplanes sp.]|nr:gamma-glutamyl-gamma-aminobutyrate hydrolase family protein [Pseudorhodoplanes sp.]
MARPAIGLTCNFGPGSGPSPRPRCYLNAEYADAVFGAGGLPLLLPVPADFDDALLDEWLSRCDGLILTGGLDLDPALYGQTRHPNTETLPARRQRFELDLFCRADARRVPMLCICLGHQVAHVARGGALIQHIDDLPRSPRVAHSRADEGNALHAVAIAPDSRLAAIVGGTRIDVPSRHHQCVDASRPGRGLRTAALAPDGVIEASEDMNDRFLLSVQWHPESLADQPPHAALFTALVQSAAGRSTGLAP